MHIDPDVLISALGLEPHIEGGYFREIFRSDHKVPAAVLPESNTCERSLSTSIYFVLKSGEFSRFHKLLADEIWYYHAGCPAKVYMFSPDGNFSQILLGTNVLLGEVPQLIIPAGTVFGSEPAAQNSFTFMSCMVSPGFDYRDFSLCDTDDLLALHPEYADLFKRFDG